MYLCTLQEQDIGQSSIKVNGRHWYIASAIGRVLPDDVGKRVFVNNSVISVENDQQRDKRLARGQ
jgi:hypothetical protein